MHRAQDYILENPDQRITTDHLARIAAMSPRNFTRVFRRATGLSPKQFALKIRVQVAKDLLDDPRRTIESIAESCGFQNARQLRRIWQRSFGTSIAAFRQAGKGIPALREP